MDFLDDFLTAGRYPCVLFFGHWGVHLCQNIYVLLKVWIRASTYPTLVKQWRCPASPFSQQEAVAENTLATEPWGVSSGVEVWDP